MKPTYRKRREGWDRLSSSGVETFLRCSVLFWALKDTKNRKSNIALEAGSAVHEAAKNDARSRMLKSVGLSISDMVALAVECYDVATSAVEMANSPLEIARARDEVVDMTTTYARGAWETISNTKILAVEEPVYTYLSDGKAKIELVGTMDREEGDYPWDIKTGRQWTKGDVAQSRQFAIYKELFQSKHGRRPKGAKVQNVCKVRGRYEHSVITAPDMPGEREALWKTLKSTNTAIKKGVELPAHQGAWFCSKKWCPEFGSCKYVIGRDSK